MGANFYGELVVRITSDTSGLKKGLAESSGAVTSAGQTMGQKLNRVGMGLQNIGRTMTQFVTLPVAAGFAIAGVAAYKFEDQLIKIKNLTGLTAAETKKYGDQILALSATGQTPLALSEAFYFLASSGFKGQEAMDALNVAAKASSAGLGDVMAVADVLSSAVNAYGHSNLTAAHMVDVLMKTIEAGKAEPQQLAASLGRIMPVAQGLKVPIEDLGGMIAGLTLTGLSSAEAVTALRGAMMALTAPTKMSIDAYKELGMTYKEVTDRIAKKGLIETLQFLYEKVDGDRLAMRKLIPNVRALNGVLSLLGPNYKKNLEVIEQVNNAQGKLNKTFEDTKTTNVFKIREAWSKLQAEFIKIGAIILPYIARLVQWIARLAESFNGLTPGWKNFILKAALAAAVLGPLAMILGSVFRAAALIGPVLFNIGGALGVIRGASVAASAAGMSPLIAKAGSLLAVLGPLKVGILGVVAAAAAVYGIVKLSDWLDGTTDRIGKMRKAAEAVKNDDSIRKWADRQFGGHLEAQGKNGFKFVMKPVIEAPTNLLANWTRTAAAEARVAEKEARQQARIDAAVGQKAFLEQEIKNMEQSLQMGGARIAGPMREQAVKAGNAYIASLRAQLKGVSAVIGEQTAKFKDMKLRDQAIVFKANIADVKAKIKDVEAKLKEVRKEPHTIKMMLKEERLMERLAGLKSGLGDITRKSYQVRLSLKIEDIERDITLAERRLERLRGRQGGEGGRGQYDPKVGADITNLEKFLEKARAKLERLNGLKTEPKVTVPVGPAFLAINLIQQKIDAIRGKNVSVVVNQVSGSKVRWPKNAQGGIYSKSTIVEVGEDGPEVILPLSKPRRMAELMQRAGMVGTSAGRAAGNVASKAAATSARIASTVAGAISGSLGGLKKKNTAKLTNAAEVSGAIQTLIDFVYNISEALEKLNTATVPKLAAGWKAKIRKIISQAVKVSNLIATELNKAFPWTKGKKGKGDKPDIDPAMGRRGVTASHAAETASPVQSLVDFVAGIVASFADLDATKLDAGMAGLRLVVAKAKEIAGLTKSIALEVSKAFAGDAKTKGGGSFTETISNAASAAVQMAGDLVGVISDFTDITEEGLTKAVAGMRSVIQTLFNTEIAFYVAAIAYMFGKVFKGAEVDTAVNDASSAAASLTSDLVGIIKTFSEMTGDGVTKALAGMEAVIAAMPGLTAGIVRIASAMQAAFAGQTVDEAFAKTSSAIAGVVNDITGAITSLGGMTNDAVMGGIYGAETLAREAEKLGVALTNMVNSLTNAVRGIDAASLDSLQKVSEMLANIASNIAAIVNNLADMTNEKVAAAIVAGSSLGQGFYDGLLSWHQRIIALAQRIAADTADALGAAGGTPAAAYAGGGGGSAVVNNVQLTDNSQLIINLPPSLTASEARYIAKQEIAAFESRKAAAADAARRGML